MDRMARHGITGIALCLGVAGCAEVPLYDEGRDKQAQELTQSIKKIDLVALVTEQQARFSKLQEFEAQTARDGADLRFARDVADAAGDRPLRIAYKKQIDDRLKKLLGGEVPSLAQARDMRSGAVVSNDRMSVLSKRSDAAVKARKDYNAEEAQVVAARQELQAAQAVYDKELKDVTPRAQDESYRAKVEAAAAKLENAVKKIEAKATENKTLGAYVHASTLESLDALEKVADAVGSGKSDPAQLTPEQRRAVAVIRLIPTVADDADKLLKDAKRLRLAPLVLSIDQQRLALQSFEESRAVRLKRVLLLEQAKDDTVLELRALAKARAWLHDGEADAVPLDAKLGALTEKNPVDVPALRNLYRSFGEFFDNAERWRRAADESEAAAGFTAYEEEMVKSKYAALQWQKLLDGTAGVLADYHASGVKPQDLSDFAKAMGLIFIGSQVGK